MSYKEPKIVLEETTDLSEVQVSLLERIIKLLPFSISVTQQDVVLFALTRDKKYLRITADKDKYTYSILSGYEVPIWREVLHLGRSIQGYQELDNRQLALQLAFPIIDNGGRVIGGVAFQNPHVDSAVSTEVIEQNRILVETTCMAILAPQENYKNLYDPVSYQDGVIIFDEGGTILYGNEFATRLVNLLGFDRRLIGSSIYGSSLKLSFVKNALSKRQGAMSEEIYHNIVIQQRVVPVSIGRGERRSFLFLKDYTRESKQQQELLVKNSVIKEIHHRVKNNLQTVAGLLRMEARRSTSQEVKSTLQESISRIESMALVHDIVSHYDEDYISIRSIYDELGRLLKNSMLIGSQQVKCSYDGDDVIISAHQASYISLVINELISNSLEHGLEGNSGQINLSVSETVDTITLVLSDDGKGLASDFNLAESKRLGLQIIKNLVYHELRGTIQMVNGEAGGLVVTITFEKGE